MPYPRMYVGRYQHLVDWLRLRGHIVYNYEMWCHPMAYTTKDLRTRYHYAYVDVVSWFRNNLYAWEYKSQNDNVKRGVEQCINYARSFNYVCLAAEGSILGDSYDRLRKLGAGVYAEVQNGFTELEKPKLQSPVLAWNQELVERFKKYALKERNLKKKMLNDGRNKFLTDF